MGFVLDVFARAGDWLGGVFQTDLNVDATTHEFDDCDIEFVGGPYDGMVKGVRSCDVWQLPVIVEIPVSRKRLQGDLNRCASASDQPTSVAVYVQTGDGPHWRYRYDSSLGSS